VNCIEVMRQVREWASNRLQAISQTGEAQALNRQPGAGELTEIIDAVKRIRDCLSDPRHRKEIVEALERNTERPMELLASIAEILASLIAWS